MDAKKCDRCGRFYSEYGAYKAGEREFEVKKSSMIRTGAKTCTGKFIYEKHFDLCPICMDELTDFLNDPNAFQCLGNCNECENRDDCEVLAENELMENYTKEKTDEQIQGNNAGWKNGIREFDSLGIIKLLDGTRKR